MTERIKEDQAKEKGKFVAPAPRVGGPEVERENRSTYNCVPLEGK